MLVRRRQFSEPIPHSALRRPTCSTTEFHQTRTLTNIGASCCAQLAAGGNCVCYRRARSSEGGRADSDLSVSGHEENIVPITECDRNPQVLRRVPAGAEVISPLRKDARNIWLRGGPARPKPPWASAELASCPRVPAWTWRITSLTSDQAECPGGHPDIVSAGWLPCRSGPAMTGSLGTRQRYARRRCFRRAERRREKCSPRSLAANQPGQPKAMPCLSPWREA
jgi:hypothetical protein